MAKLLIWAECFRPFRMGGDVNQPIATEIELTEEPVKLSRSVSVVVIHSPKGTTHVAEVTSGAFVGDSLEQVQQDFAEADPKVVRQQIKNAVAKRGTAQVMSNEEFWSCFRRR